MPRVNRTLQRAILEIVDNQLREGRPPATRQTLERLMASGCSRAESRRLIGAAVITEIWTVLQRREPYDEARYIAALQRLPQRPYEE